MEICKGKLYQSLHIEQILKEMCNSDSELYEIKFDMKSILIIVFQIQILI